MDNSIKLATYIAIVLEVIHTSILIAHHIGVHIMAIL